MDSFYFVHMRDSDISFSLKKSRGVREVKKEIESLSSMGESLRKKTADILDKLEKRVRGEDKMKEEEKIKGEEGEISKTKE